MKAGCSHIESVASCCFSSRHGTAQRQSVSSRVLYQRVVIFKKQLHKGFGSFHVGLSPMIFAKQTKRKAVIPSISKQYSVCQDIEFHGESDNRLLSKRYVMYIA